MNKNKKYVIEKIQGYNCVFMILECPVCNHEWQSFEWTTCPDCGNKVILQKEDNKNG